MGKEHWALKTLKNENPGPGSYNIASEFGKDALKYTIRKRIPDKIPETAGVPMLALPSSFDGRKVMLPPHDPDYCPSNREITKMPGPEYMPPGMGKKPVSARSGRRRKSIQSSMTKRNNGVKSYNTNPHGPAEYNTRQDPTKTQTPISIGVRPKDYSLRGETPGPDAYSPRQQPTRKSFSNACSFGARNDMITPRSFSPGPIYNPRPEISSKTYRIGQKVPMPVEKIDITPSPGDFDLPPFGKDTRPTTFSKSFARDIKQEFGNSPAPYYNIPSQFDNPKGITITGRRSASPDSYGWSSRQSSARSPRTAPGSARASGRDSMGGYGYGYGDNRDFNKAQRIRERIRAKAEDQTPGPGYYDIKVERSSRSYKMAKPPKFTKTVSLDDGQTPGPGYYNPDYNAAKPGIPSFSFKDECGAVYNRVHEPDPPFYDVSGKTRTMNQSPRFSIGQRTNLVYNPCFTQDAGYYLLPGTNEGPYHSIHLRDRHELVPE